MKKFILLTCLFGCFISAYAQTCSNNQSFSSYSEAFDYLNSTRFDCTDTYDATGESSWIGRIEWYSCGCTEGYLVVELQGRSYIHRNVPKRVFIAFTQAESKGRFYDSYIRGRYQL